MKILFYCFWFVTLLVNCQEENSSDVENGSSIGLNKNDSLVMIKFHESMGGFGWDLKNCSTWENYVTFEYDSLLKESFVVAIECGYGFMKDQGELPKELGELSHLRIFYVQDPFHRLVGELPMELFNCPLEYFHVEADVHGVFTSAVGKIANTIRNFLVQGTYMSGQLPREFGLFKNLNTPLVLLGNQFSGYLPKEFSSIKRGVFLLDNNISSIEWEFFDIPRDKAWEVVMKNNKLVGEIPEYVFKTEYWQDFSYNFTIQKEGYGFSNFRDGL